MKNISRFFYYLYRLCNSIRFLGLLNTIKVFYFSKYSNSKIMNIKSFNNKFYFRPKIDVGSYTRLTKSQYIIKGSLNQPIEFVIDAGSNIGSQTVRFLYLNKEIKKIICIEPSIDTYEICKKNLKNYPVILYNNALASTSNEELLFQKHFNSEMSKVITTNYEHLNKSNNYYKIKTISINDILNKNNIKRIDFIKLDVEGSEKEVFSKNTEWLKLTNCLAFNNGDINDVTFEIINLYKKAVGDIKIYNIDQMIILMKKNINWLATKGFISSKTIGYLEKDERY